MKKISLISSSNSLKLDHLTSLMKVCGKRPGPKPQPEIGESEIGPLLGLPDGTSKESAKLPEVATAQ